MRLLRIHLREFRGVHDREIAFAEQGVTVLEGENEVGKTSTLAALDLLIDYRDDSRAAAVRECAPAGRDAGPAVEAEFVTGPYRLVYGKRWLRRSATELTIHRDGRQEQLTGRAAHDRVAAILDETIDRSLWRALRVEQHAPLGQAELGGHAALTRALDRAAAGNGASGATGDVTGASGATGDVTGASGATGDVAGPVADGAAEDLVTRAFEEMRRYHGGHGRPVGPLRESVARLEAARAEVEAAGAAVAEVERDVTARGELDREAAALTVERREQTERVGELERRATALEARRAEVTAVAERAEWARERAGRAADREEVRARLVSAAGEAGTAAARAAEVVTGHERHDTARREDHEERRAAAGTARADADTAAAAARAADGALVTARDRRELAELRGRLRRAETADEARRAAAGGVGGRRVTAADVERLEELDHALVRAEAELAAGAASVEVVGLDAASEITVDGEARPVAPGETTTLPVSGPVTVGVPGVVELRVRPGRDGDAVRRRVAAAREQREAECTRLGVTDPAAARAALRTADDAAARERELGAVVARELGGRSLDDVRAAIARLVDRLPAAERPDAAGASGARGRRAKRAGSPAEPGLFEEAGLLDPGSGEDPDDDAAADLEPLRREADRSREAAGAADRAAREAEDAARRAEEAVRAGESEVAAARTALAVARSDADRLAAELAAARAEQGDVALATAATEAAAHARRTEAEHQQRAADLAADDPATVEALHTTARRAVAALTQRGEEVGRRRDEVTGRLQVAGGQGRYDRLAAARAELAAAEREHAAIDRRAAAAKRLHTVLARRRDEVRRAYVDPFRREVERLARIVFGPSLVLEVDPALRIVSRTLDGVTVAFDALSTGAREQLGLCARLAVAALVDAEDGVPVMIDDALGHSDPARLERLAAVFTAATAGTTHQVVVLTCSPARYRGVGAARTVTLDPSLPPPRAVPPPAPEPPGEPDATDTAAPPATGSPAGETAAG